MQNNQLSFSFGCVGGGSGLDVFPNAPTIITSLTRPDLRKALGLDTFEIFNVVFIICSKLFDNNYISSVSPEPASDSNYVTITNMNLNTLKNYFLEQLMNNYL